MPNLTWTINCILFGAGIIKLIKELKYEEALIKIKNLTSEFDDVNANYLLERLIQVNSEA